ncbi:hypothetical protein F0L68_42050, partial [Solihabitans fulvus]
MPRLPRWLLPALLVLAVVPTIPAAAAEPAHQDTWPAPTFTVLTPDPPVAARSVRRPVGGGLDDPG